MGVDYYNCEVCNEIYAYCNDCSSCEGCDARWGPCCIDDVQKFIFNGEERCTLCWKDTPKRPDSDELLQFALKKLKKTEYELENEFCAEEDRTPPDYFYCTECPTRECPNTECECVSKPHEDDDGCYEIQRIGFCCKAQEFEDDDIWCNGCLAWRRRKFRITMLFLRKNHEAFARLPKDVLKYILNK